LLDLADATPMLFGTIYAIGFCFFGVVIFYTCWQVIT
jgi:hypothetical protein